MAKLQSARRCNPAIGSGGAGKRVHLATGEANTRPGRYPPAVRTRRLGTEGPEVSVVGLGCNNFGGRVDRDGTRAVVDAALDAGVTLFDTADIYGNRGGSEEFLGDALQGRRERVVLATKFGGDMADGTRARGSQAYIRKAIDASLRRLRTDHVDLYQYHSPD